MHLAQINIGRVLNPVDDPRMADFTDNLDAINALAETSPGFVWRLKDDSGNATAIPVHEDPAVIVNMSVWESVEALHAFAYQTAHRSFVQRRKEWFHPFGGAYVALWWVPAGYPPTVADGLARLDQLRRFGPTVHAFNFRRAFPPEDASPLGPAGPADGDVGEPWRACG